jgi:hypothetical protein
MERQVLNFENVTVNENGIVKYNGRELPAYPNGRGYLKVFIPSKDGKKKSRAVHRLAAQAFIPNPDGLPVVNHMDGDKTNNAVSNLEWVSYRDNTLKALEVRTPERRPVARIYKNGAIAEVFLSIAQAAKFHKCDYRGLYEAVKNGTKYKGFLWRYCDIKITLAP